MCVCVCFCLSCLSVFKQWKTDIRRAALSSSNGSLNGSHGSLNGSNGSLNGSHSSNTDGKTAALTGSPCEKGLKRYENNGRLSPSWKCHL